jgi:hypothetical protein
MSKNQTAKEKTFDAVLAAASRPKETRRGNELSAARLTVANALKRGAITAAQAIKKIKT